MAGHDGGPSFGSDTRDDREGDLLANSTAPAPQPSILLTGRARLHWARLLRRTVASRDRHRAHVAYRNAAMRAAHERGVDREAIARAIGLSPARVGQALRGEPTPERAAGTVSTGECFVGPLLAPVPRSGRGVTVSRPAVSVAGTALKAYVLDVVTEPYALLSPDAPAGPSGRAAPCCCGMASNDSSRRGKRSVPGARPNSA
jgi:hypothetical protein